MNRQALSCFVKCEVRWKRRVSGTALPLRGDDIVDIEVEMDPAAWRAGHDPQLEKAVEVLLEELKKHPRPPQPKRPPFPNYHNGKPADSSK